MTGLVVLNIIVVLNVVVMSAFVMFFKTHKELFRIFAALIFIPCLVFVINTIEFLGLLPSNRWIILLASSSLLWSPLLLVFVYKGIKKKIGKSIWFHFIPFIAVFFSHILILTSKDWSNDYFECFKLPITTTPLFNVIVNSVVLLQTGLYLTYAIIKLRNFKKGNKTGVELASFSLDYLYILLIVNGVTICCYFFFDRVTVEGYLIPISYLIFYYGLLFSSYRKLLTQRDHAQDKYVHLDDQKRLDNLDKLLAALDDEAIITTTNMSLVEFSNHIGIPKNYTSAILNEHFKKNFNEVINERRNQLVIDYLKRGDLSKFSLESIGSMAGYSSKTTFYRSFKKQYGCTPLEYIKKESQSII